jgi:D-beta-D-heptose 7-phosphate kinase/D-beta-D-heptose 1-phosphate adenosyltransferase
MNQSHASEILTACEGKRIAVIGDLMLDRYVSGKSSRISQEAPVPVVAVDDTRDVPGGAANVVRNIVALGANVSVFGVVGADAAGERLRAMLADSGVNVDAILESESRRTTEKTRVLANRQQVVRIDTEDTHPATTLEETELKQSLRHAIVEGEIDAIIVEDYAKGLVTPGLVTTILAQAEKAEISVALDPHPANIMHTDGITAMTPNRSEAFQLAGLFESKPVADPLKDEALFNAAKVLAERYGVHYLLITLGPQGMILFRDGADPRHVETKAREVFDVSGAGDTVIATLSLALAGGAAIEDAADLANHAAGIVVGKAGTAVVERQELIASFGDSG